MEKTLSVYIFSGILLGGLFGVVVGNSFSLPFDRFTAGIIGAVIGCIAGLIVGLVKGRRK